MPNHCFNKLTISGLRESVDEFIKDRLDENCNIDFNLVHPMPKALEDVHTGWYELNGREVRLWREDRTTGHKTPVESDEVRALQMLYGVTNPRDWKVNNWGTKWNAYDHGDMDRGNHGLEHWAEFDFTTAWGPPKKWLQDLNKACPRLFLQLEFTVEGGQSMGSFAFEPLDDIDFHTIREHNLSLKEDK